MSQQDHEFLEEAAVPYTQLGVRLPRCERCHGSGLETEIVRTVTGTGYTSGVPVPCSECDGLRVTRVGVQFPLEGSLEPEIQMELQHLGSGGTVLVSGENGGLYRCEAGLPQVPLFETLSRFRNMILNPLEAVQQPDAAPAERVLTVPTERVADFDFDPIVPVTIDSRSLIGNPPIRSETIPVWPRAESTEPELSMETVRDTIAVLSEDGKIRLGENHLAVLREAVNDTNLNLSGVTTPMARSFVIQQIEDHFGVSPEKHSSRRRDVGPVALARFQRLLTALRDRDRAADSDEEDD